MSEAIKIRTISIACGLSDGTTRLLHLQNEKQAKQIAGYITHIQGGKTKIGRDPVVIMTAEAADRMARDAVAYNRPGLWHRFLARIRSSIALREKCKGFPAKCKGSAEDMQSDAGLAVTGA